MVNCESIKGSPIKICAADYNRKIKIQTTAIIAKNSPNTAAITSFTDLATVWSKIVTKAGNRFVDGVGAEAIVTTDFYIRYTASINFEQELWVERAGNRFKISSVENIDKENITIRLRSIERGSKNIAANQR